MTLRRPCSLPPSQLLAYVRYLRGVMVSPESYVLCIKKRLNRKYMYIIMFQPHLHSVFDSKFLAHRFPRKMVFLFKGLLTRSILDSITPALLLPRFNNVHVLHTV